jgi:hypothetical protein
VLCVVGVVGGPMPVRFTSPRSAIQVSGTLLAVSDR